MIGKLRIGNPGDLWIRPGYEGHSVDTRTPQVWINMTELLLHEVKHGRDIATRSPNQNTIADIKRQIHGGNFNMKNLDACAVWVVLNDFVRDFASPAISTEIERNLFNASKCFQHCSCTYYCPRVVINSIRWPNILGTKSEVQAALDQMNELSPQIKHFIHDVCKFLAAFYSYVRADADTAGRLLHDWLTSSRGRKRNDRHDRHDNFNNYNKMSKFYGDNIYSHQMNFYVFQV